MKHKVYSEIVKAIKQGILVEPFSTQDFQRACPNLGAGTYTAFLYKHKKGNKQKDSELFKKVGINTFIVIRPYKYGL